jgi:hypothetical protein
MTPSISQELMYNSVIISIHWLIYWLYFLMAFSTFCLVTLKHE